MYKDRKYIRGIVDELINNSIKAKATQVDAHIHLVEDEICVHVKDNGKGMVSEELAEVKKKLEQPRRDELEEYYGALAGQSMVGTGLSLVGMMSDRADVVTRLGKGTEITIYRKAGD